MNPFERDMHRAAADCEVVPVAGWTVPSSRSAKSASGATLVPASPRRPPQVTAGLKGPSSRLARSVRDPSGSGSGMSVAWMREVGKRSGGFSAQFSRFSSSSASELRIHAVIHRAAKQLGKITEWILGAAPKDDDGGGGG